MLKGIYLLPSLITTANLGVGFLSILFSINGQLTQAAWCIIIGIVLDMTDGRVAG